MTITIYTERIEIACVRAKSAAYYKGEFSELGKRAALLLDTVWGMHHLNSTSLKKVEWGNKDWIEFVYDRPLATVDFDELTKLVVLAHQFMLRVAIEGAAPRYLRITIHLRKNRDGLLVDRCPHIGDVVKYHATRYPEIEVTP